MRKKLYKVIMDFNETDPSDQEWVDFFISVVIGKYQETRTISEIMQAVGQKEVYRYFNSLA